MKMKAAVLESPKNISVTYVNVPELKKGEILVKIKACGVCGSDLRFYEHGDRIKKFPFIIGHEIAGEVADVGQGVEKFHIKDRIAMGNEIPCKECNECKKGLEMLCKNVLSIGTTIPGGFAEYIILPEIAVKNGPINFIPDNVDFLDATLAEPLASVYNGLEFARMKKGKSVLVIGAGPIGNLMINLSQAMGASKTVVVDSNQKRLEMSESIGADHYIHSENNDFIDEALHINSDGYDIVVCACSNINAIRSCMPAVAKGGFINLFGGIPKSQDDLVSFSVNNMHYRQFAIGGSFSSTKEHHRKSLEFISSGKIKADKIITHKFALDDIIKAFNTVKNQEGLKVVIVP